MRNLICELKLPFVVLAVMTVVWSAGQRAAAPPPDYYPTPDRAAWNRVAGMQDRDVRASPREGSPREAPVVTLDAEK